MKRAVLIVNPYSTHVTGERITAVERVLRERVELETKFTQRPGHATELAAEYAHDVDGILVFSGDGTYNEALNGGVGAVPFGFLPGGGTSVLPRALGLPRDPVEAARAIAGALESERHRRISLGSVNGRRFCFSAGLGFDGEAVRRLDALGRDPGGARPGDLAFVRMIMKMLRRAPRALGPADRDRGCRARGVPPRRERRSVLVRGLDPAPHRPRRASSRAASTSSRRRAFARATCRGSLRYIVRGRGQLEADDMLTGHDLDRIVVRCDRPLPLQSDGEDLGDVVEAVFEAKRDAVCVLV